MSGDPIIRASWAGTVVFGASAIAAALTRSADMAAAAVALALFAAGIAVFFWAYAVAVNRSRTDAIGIGGLFFLAGPGTAPIPVKRALLSSLALQSLIGLGTAGARPFTTLAFGVLVPLYGLSLTGLWGARNGTFGRRQPGRRTPPSEGSSS